MGDSGLQIVVQISRTDTISRRQAAQFLLSAAAAGFALPAFSLDEGIWQHIAHADLSDSQDAHLASANWKPLFLTAGQEDLLRSLAEVMLPGSTNTHVSRFIDLLLSVDKEAAQKKFLGSLEAIDEDAHTKFGKPFGKLTAQDQHSLLSAISSELRSGDQASRMRGHFEDLKEWIVPAYYSSETGMRELGWTPDRVFATFPSCLHAEGHS